MGWILGLRVPWPTAQLQLNQSQNIVCGGGWGILISRAQPTLKLPCISPQSSVTCNGEYRRPVIEAQPSFHDVDAENGERKLYVI